MKKDTLIKNVVDGYYTLEGATDDVLFHTNKMIGHMKRNYIDDTILHDLEKYQLLLARLMHARIDLTLRACSVVEYITETKHTHRREKR